MTIDQALVRQVLFQAYQMDYNAIVEIYAKAWCLGDMSLADWYELRAHLLQHELVEEWAPEHFKLTEKGMGVLDGQDYA